MLETLFAPVVYSSNEREIKSVAYSMNILSFKLSKIKEPIFKNLATTVLKDLYTPEKE